MPLILYILFLRLTQCSLYIEVQVKKNILNLPIISLCDDQELLLDTGSSQVWMADNDCSSCSKTLSLCPQERKSNKRISYFKGSVEGNFVKIKTCLGQDQIMCVKESNSLSNIQSHGIVGIKGQSTGKDYFKKFIKLHKIQNQKVSIYYGHNQVKVFVGECPQIYKKQLFIKLNNSNWSTRASSMIINSSQKIKANCAVHFDTGSNILILQSSLYQAVLQFINQVMYENECYKMQDLLSFECTNPLNLDFNITLTMQQNKYTISLQNMATIKDGIVVFMLEKTSENICILGTPAFKNYLLQFHMNGSLYVYHSNKGQLAKLEQANFRSLILQYIFCVLLLSFVAKYLSRVVYQKINKKIVI